MTYDKTEAAEPGRFAAIIKRFIPFYGKELDTQHAGIELHRFTPEQFIAMQHNVSPGYCYLLEGTVALQTRHGEQLLVEAHTLRSRYPLWRGPVVPGSVQALTPVACLKVPRGYVEEQGENDTLWQHPRRRDRDLLENAFYQQLLLNLNEGELELPVMPAMLARIHAISEEDSTVDTVVRILQADMILAARMISVANSVMYRHMEPVTSLRDAVMRLGLQQTQQLAISFVTSNLLRKIPVPEGLRDTANHIWTHSLDIAASSWVIARQSSAKTINPETALLAGLLHDIGALPILAFAAQHPELAARRENVQQAMNQLQGRLGAALLAEWKLPDKLVTAAREAQCWWRNVQPQADYADVVLAAQLLGRCPPEYHWIPLTSLPAYGKLGLATASDGTVLAMRDHEDERADIRQMLAL